MLISTNKTHKLGYLNSISKNQSQTLGINFLHLIQNNQSILKYNFNYQQIQITTKKLSALILFNISLNILRRFQTNQLGIKKRQIYWGISQIYLGIIVHLINNYNNPSQYDTDRIQKSSAQQMRFFLKIKQNNKQIGVRRIESKHQLTTTKQLLALVQKSLSIDSTNFILRFVNNNGQNRLRVISGWSFGHYGIKAGLQMEVELLDTARGQIAGRDAETEKQNDGEKEKQKEPEKDNDRIGEILFEKREMPKIIQQEQQQGEKTSQISNLVSAKYQQLLKLIQKNNTQGYLKQIKSDLPNLGPCQNQFYKKQLLAIQNQLGAKGWAAIHCAVFAGNSQIVKYLIQIGVDINLKTSDQWLPIQLAVRQQNQIMIDLLLAQPTLNINICTAHGLVFNMAVHSLNQTIVRKLLLKDVDFAARDHLGRTVYDMLGSDPDKNMMELLSFEERRQSFSQRSNMRGVMYHALVKSYRGEVTCIKTPPRKSKQYYLFLNPYQQQLKIFQDKIYYPQFPKQTLPMSIIHKFQKLPKSQKSWYMKNDLSYFVVQTPKHKYIYGCHFEETVDRWVEAYQLCLENVNAYAGSIGKFERNQTVLLDRLQGVKNVAGTVKQGAREGVKGGKKLDNLISLFTSKFSERSDQSPDKNRNIIMVNGQGSPTSPIKLERSKQAAKIEQQKIINNKKNQQQVKQNKTCINGKQQKIKGIKQQSEKKSQIANKQDKTEQSSKKLPDLSNNSVNNNTSTINDKNSSISNTSTKNSVSNQSDQGTFKNSLKFSDFKITKTLGQGTFGTVFLAIDLRNPQKRKQYALKCFKKKKLVVNKQIKYTVAQLTILKQLSHPYIVNLHFTFQTPNYVYLGLDYCPNHDLSHHLMNQVTFPQKQAMIYAAQILSALEYLHQKNIIYRDLKPENIMLDADGHVRLVDFGLSKQGQDRDFVAKSFCGSPAYLSPEMLNKKGVGKESDYYCLGAVLYEMLVGQPPFFSDDIVTLYNNISTSKLTFPKTISQPAKSLLTGLLQKKPQKRLGYKSPQQIKNHAFFKDINWQNLLKRSIKAPVREEVQVQYQQQQENAIIDEILHKDFDYTPDNYRVNRFLNFSFVREGALDDQ